jgi:hypothetical protein
MNTPPPASICLLRFACPIYLLDLYEIPTMDRRAGQGPNNSTTGCRALGQSFFLSRNRVKGLDELSKNPGNLRDMSRGAGGSPRSLRRSDGEQLIARLVTQPALARAVLAWKTSVSRATVSTIVGELVARGLIITVDEVPNSDGDGRDGNRLADRTAFRVADGRLEHVR